MNKVLTIFEADARQLFTTADQVEARLKTFQAANSPAASPVNGAQSPIVQQQRLLTAGVQSEVAKQVQAQANGHKAVVDNYKTSTAEMVEIQAARDKATAELAARNAAAIRAAQEASVAQTEVAEKAKTRIIEVEAEKQRVAQSRLFSRDTLAVPIGGGVTTRLGITGPAAAAVGIGAAAVAGAGFVLKESIDQTIQLQRANLDLANSASVARISFADAAKQNQQFANSLGLSKVEAVKTTSEILSLANTANLGAQGADKLSTAIANIAAAKNIPSGQLSGIVSSIASGDGGGLNQLGINADAAFGAYARSVGKATSELTVFEREQAALDAVMQRSVIFSGAAATQMNTLEGSVKRTTSAWEDFKSKVGNKIGSSFEVNRGIQAAGNSLSIDDTDSLEKRFLAGNLSNLDIKNATRQDPLARAGSSVLAAGGLLATALPDFLLGGGVNEVSPGTANQPLRNTTATFWHTLVSDDNNLREDFLRQRLLGIKLANAQSANAAKDELDKTNKELAERDKATKTASFISDQTDIRSDQSSAIEQRFKVAEAGLSLHLQRMEASESTSIREIGNLRQQDIQQQIALTANYYNQLLSYADLDEKQRVAISRKGNAEISQLNTELQMNAFKTQQESEAAFAQMVRNNTAKVKEFADSFHSAFESVVSKDASRNQYLELLTEGDKQTKLLTQSTRGLGVEVRKALLQQSSLSFQLDRDQLRFNTLQTAGNLRNEASQFQRFQDTGSIDSRDVSNAKFQLSNNPNLSPYWKNFWEQQLADAQKKDFQQTVDQTIAFANKSFLSSNSPSAQERHLFDQAVIGATPLSRVGDLNRDERDLAIRSRQEEASFQTQQEQTAQTQRDKNNDLLDSVNKSLQALLAQISAGKPIPVDIGNQAVTQIDVKSSNLSVTTQRSSNPGRPRTTAESMDSYAGQLFSSSGHADQH